MEFGLAVFELRGRTDKTYISQYFAPLTGDGEVVNLLPYSEAVVISSAEESLVVGPYQWPAAAVLRGAGGHALVPPFIDPPNEFFCECNWTFGMNI